MNEYNTDPNQTYIQYANAVPAFLPPVTIGGGTTVVNINGATGPTVTFDGSTIGFSFSPAGSQVNLTISNATTARTALSAAKSGVNTDITQLNGASQVDVSSAYKVSGTQVVSARGAAVADATGGAVIDVEGRAAINALLARLRVHGLIS